MLRQDDIEDKFKNKPYSDRTKPTGENYYWNNNAYGRIAKIAAALMAEAHSTHMQLALGREFSILFKQSFITNLEHMLPYAKTIYEQEMNQELRYILLSQRVHKMYSQHKGTRGSGQGGISREHYSNNEKLKPYVAAVSKRVRNYEIFTKEVCDEIRKEVEGTLI